MRCGPRTSAFRAPHVYSHAHSTVHPKMGDSKNSHSCCQSCGRFGQTPTKVSSHVPTSWFLSTVPGFSVCGLQVCCALLPVVGFAAFGAALDFTLALTDRSLSFATRRPSRGTVSALCGPKRSPSSQRITLRSFSLISSCFASPRRFALLLLPGPLPLPPPV